MVCAKMLAVAIASSSALESTEQTGLLQRLNRGAVSAGLGQGTQHRSNSLAQLFQSTVTLLRTGATPDVVKFVNETLTEITSTVVPAITEAHDADVSLLGDGVAAFTPTMESYAQYVSDLANLRSEEQETRTQHKACREHELEACNHARECERERQVRWKKFQLEQHDYVEVMRTIHTKKCFPTRDQAMKADQMVWSYDSDEGSTFLKHSKFESRTDTITTHESFIKEGAERFEALTSHDEWEAHCVEVNRTHKMILTECNIGQGDLESASCASFDFRSSKMQWLDSTWSRHSSLLQSLRESVTATEADRKKEWETLKTVECILNRLYERGGKACEDDGEAESEVKTCRELDTDTTHLNVDYPADPPKPDPMTEAPYPCTAEFLDAEYSHLESTCFDHRPACNACAASLAM